jgi:hypothetical protein
MLPQLHREVLQGIDAGEFLPLGSLEWNCVVVCSCVGGFVMLTLGLSVRIMRSAVYS